MLLSCMSFVALLLSSKAAELTALCTRRHPEISTVAVQLKDWKVSPDLFPVEASDSAQQLISTAVNAAVSAWGAPAGVCISTSLSVP